MSSGLILYLIFVTIYLNVLFLAHRYIFTKYSFLKWDRMYFMGIVVFSFALPFLPVPRMFEISAQQVALNHILERISFSNGMITVQANESFFSVLKWTYYISIAYSIGFTFKSVKFLFELFQIVKISRNSVKSEIQGIKVYVTNQEEMAFTFFNKIYISKRFIELENHQQEKILKHESVHKKQGHSIDIMIAELAGIILWFNPLNKTILHTIKSVHEFLADEATIEVHNKKEYMQLLLKLAIKDEKLSTVSYFARLNLRKRISIMQRLGNAQRFKRLFLSSLPVLVFLFFSLSISNQFLIANPLFTYSKFINPFGNECKIVVPYFKLELNNQHYKYSHEKLAVELPDFTPIFAVADAKVIGHSIIDNWGVEEHSIELQTYEYNFVVEGIEKCIVDVNMFVKQGDTIGYTGKTALYPTVKFTVYKNGKTIPPQSLMKF